ncbi:hypothetical protein KUCAC02_007957, partial [Chaenocephalus aceratus]
CDRACLGAAAGRASTYRNRDKTEVWPRAARGPGGPISPNTQSFVSLQRGSAERLRREAPQRGSAERLAFVADDCLKVPRDAGRVIKGDILPAPGPFSLSPASSEATESAPVTRTEREGEPHAACRTHEDLPQ